MRRLRKRFEDGQGSLMAFCPCDCECGSCPDCNNCTCPTETYYSTYWGQSTSKSNNVLATDLLNKVNAPN